MNTFEFTFLLTSLVSHERLEWIRDVFQSIELQDSPQSPKILLNLHLSGDALYSCIEIQNNSFWISLLSQDPSQKLFTTVIIDEYECKIMGITTKIILIPLRKNIQLGPNSSLHFWEQLVKNLMERFNFIKGGFFQMEGPYMSRTSLYGLRFLTTCVHNNANPEYYAYLDGVHTGHPRQTPSEFENIGKFLIDIQNECKDTNRDFLIQVCSRCAKARGYIVQHEVETNIFTVNDQVIPGFAMCNLNRIIDRFELPHIILSSNSGVIYKSNMDNNKESSHKPAIVVFITHTPYGSEWSFGGISFALACANHDIKSSVVFIEEGVFNIINGAEINEVDHLFNTNEVIEATNDIESIGYYYYLPSATIRGLNCEILSNYVKPLDAKDLLDLFLDISQNSVEMTRIYFF